MTAIPRRLRQFVLQRAGGSCEYCGLAQEGQEATFHIDHIVPQIANGQTVSTNLALACVSCSLYKGARQTGIDPLTGEEAPLFHPRLNSWHEHFGWDGIYLHGLTSIGRATVVALKMNRPLILAIRREERLLGRSPRQ